MIRSINFYYLRKPFLKKKKMTGTGFKLRTTLFINEHLTTMSQRHDGLRFYGIMVECSCRELSGCEFEFWSSHFFKKMTRTGFKLTTTLFIFELSTIMSQMHNGLSFYGIMVECSFRELGGCEFESQVVKWFFEDVYQKYNC